MDYTNIIEVHGERAGRLRPPFVPSTRDYGWQSKATAAERRAGGRQRFSFSGRLRALQEHHPCGGMHTVRL